MQCESPCYVFPFHCTEEQVRSFMHCNGITDFNKDFISSTHIGSMHYNATSAYVIGLKRTFNLKSFDV
jgi:hypothetical protein